MADNIQILLSSITEKMNALDTAKQLYSTQLAPDFNVFSYLRTDEMGLSRVIADLLNPKGAHAQKTRFLIEFIAISLPSLTKQEEWQAFYKVSVIQSAEVFVEELTWKMGSSRRMDIYLSFTNENANTFGICIENKPYASDEDKQLSDYAKELQKRHGDNFHLVYLDERNEPSTKSVSAKTLSQWQSENRFTWLKFSELLPWLKACKGVCENPSVLEFLNQFDKYLLQEFLGISDMSIEDAVLAVMMENEKNIISALKVSQNVTKMVEKHILVLVEQITALLAIEQAEEQTKITTVFKSYKTILFTIDKCPLNICFELNGNFTHPELGLRFFNKEMTNKDTKFLEIREKLKEGFSNIRSNHPSWCGWYRFEPNDWINSADVWKQIQNGTMAEKITKEVLTYYAFMKDNDLITFDYAK